MSKKKIILITIILIILIIIGLWISEIIPKFIAKQVAINYTKNINMWLEYKEMQYTNHFDCWNVVFIDKDNNQYSINVESKYFPFKVVYDGVYQSSLINDINYNDPIPKRNNTDNKPVNDIADNKFVNDTIDITTVNKWDASKVSIKIKEGTLTNEGATIVITDKNDAPISWGVDFLVEVKKDDKWELAPQKAQVMWIEIAMMPNENGITEINCKWTEMYGKLESGTYRIVKNYYSQQYDKVYSEPFIID